MTTKDETFRRLHQLAHAAVFGLAPWPLSDPATNLEIERLLRGMDSRMLNSEVVELLLLCIGYIEPYDSLAFLEGRHVSQEEIDLLFPAPTLEENLATVKQWLDDAYDRTFIRSAARH
jgi:hypothetical protein